MREAASAITALPRSAPDGLCPACRESSLQLVLEQRDAPVHTSQLLATRVDALAYPTATIRLQVCRRCGLLTNTAFEAEEHDYSASYEEVQIHSPRFRAYASDLAAALVGRHGLRGRPIFEIGSGRGDFLSLLVEAGVGTARAVDPSYRGELDDRRPVIEIERKFFEPDDIPPGTALIVSRHTLEHVHDVLAFLTAVRDGLARAPDAAVAVEVPDTLRILRETAFWDVFYEHCSYFTPGSLARAFRTAGFDVEHLELTFEDQYVLITARSATEALGTPLPLEDDVAETGRLATEYGRQVEAMRGQWLSRLREARARGETSVIWGAGSKGVGFLTALGLADEIACAVDLNPGKQGRFMPGTGHEIVAPAALVDVRPSLVVLMNPAYREEVVSDLRGLGVDAAVVAL